MRERPDRSALWVLFRYELKMLLRDRRTIFVSVLLPLIVLPVWIGAMRFTETRGEERRETRTYRYAVAGTWADEARALLDEASSRPDTGSDARMEEVRTAAPDSLLAAGELDVVVRALTAAEASAWRDSAEAADPGRAVSGEEMAETVRDALAEPSPEVPMIQLSFRGDREQSESGASLVQSRLSELREDRRHAAYRTAGLPVDPDELAVVEREGIATAEKETAAQIAIWLTPLLVMLMLSGGSVVAADTISGEKERGTLETLLTTSVQRREIVLAKQLLIITVGVAIAVINLANIGIYLGLGWFELPEQFVVRVEPLALLVLLLVFLPVTVLASSILLMLSGYANSYKEYQVYFFPVMLAFLVPSLAAILPGMELSSVIALVPLANTSVAVREVLTGHYDWPFLLLAIGSTLAVAAWFASLTERALGTERLISGSDTDEADLAGGAALFPRHVLRLFAVLWVVFFLSSLWFVGSFGIRGQVLYNVVGLFLGFSLLVIWRYRLQPRQALALRMPRPAVWLGVLIGAPSAFITGLGIAELGQYVFPVPERVLEAFGQFALPEGMPLWQVVFFLAVLPGICEEIAFRGVLLHGLRRKLRPVLLVLVTGAIFGFFHVDLFRLLPVTYLGIILGAVTVATGSIFPAMLWHTLNNSVALIPPALGWWAPDGETPAWLYVIGVIGLLTSAALIWRFRTPYPGMLERDRREVPGEALASSV